LNPLDIGVIAIIGLSAVFAFARGFVREALSIVAWVGAGFITLYGFTYVYVLVDPMVRNPLLSQLIAGFGLFVASLIVLTIVTGLIARRVRSSALSPIDRTLGFIFGVLRGAFIICLAYLLLDMAVPSPDRPGWLREAKSAPYLQQGADMLRSVLPESLRQKTSAAADDVRQAVSPEAQVRAAIGAMTHPAAPAQTAPAPASTPAYKPGDQKELDRIINNTQR
jgi:membrane protein required for colicin V production